MIALLVPALLALAGMARGQQGAPAPQPALPDPQPALMDCGAHGGSVEILCGTRSPEDLEPTPDGKFLIVSQFVNGRGGTGGAGLVLFDLAKKTFTKMTVKEEPRKDWGDPACPGPPGGALLPHGISLSRRAGSGKALQLYVVNHGGRQSMEMFELKRAGPGWELAWHGCFVSKQDYNDVAALADGGFIATHPTALRAPGDTSNLLGGQATGYVVRWAAAGGEVELPDTRIGYPNGVIVTPDQHYMYVNAWTAREVHKYDLKEGKETDVIKLKFMPDNYPSDEKSPGNCRWGGGNSRRLSGGKRRAVHTRVRRCGEIDPATMEAQTLLDWKGKISPISGVSVALKAGTSLYLGAFQGDRIVEGGLEEVKYGAQLLLPSRKLATQHARENDQGSAVTKKRNNQGKIVFVHEIPYRELVSAEGRGIRKAATPSLRLFQCVPSQASVSDSPVRTTVASVSAGTLPLAPLTTARHSARMA